MYMAGTRENFVREDEQKIMRSPEEELVFDEAYALKGKLTSFQLRLDGLDEEERRFDVHVEVCVIERFVNLR